MAQNTFIRRKKKRNKPNADVMLSQHYAREYYIELLKHSTIRQYNTVIFTKFCIYVFTRKHTDAQSNIYVHICCTCTYATVHLP